MSRTPVALRLAAHSTEEIARMIEEDLMSLAKIAAAWGCTRRQVQLWIDGNPERVERVRQARQVAGEAAVDKAEKALLDIPDMASVAAVARQRELSFYYRWLASKLNPNAFGDKLELRHKIETDPNLMTDAALMAIAAGGRVIDGEAEDVTGNEGREAPQVPPLRDSRNPVLA